MGCIQHEVHTTLICTCRYAVLQVFLRHVQMCILTPQLEYKLPKGRTWSSIYYPPPPVPVSRILVWESQALGNCCHLSEDQGQECAKPTALKEGVKNTGEQLCHHQDRVITCAKGMPKWPPPSHFVEREVRLQVVAG